MKIYFSGNAPKIIFEIIENHFLNNDKGSDNSSNKSWHYFDPSVVTGSTSALVGIIGLVFNIFGKKANKEQLHKIENSIIITDEENHIRLELNNVSSVYDIDIRKNKKSFSLKINQKP